MRRKIFNNMCILVICTVMIVMVVTTFVYYRSLEKRIMQDNTEIFSLIRNSVETGGIDYLKTINTDSEYRITHISKEGEVLFDNYVKEEDLSDIENHLNRPEVQDTLKNGVGKDVRISDTFDMKYYYYAEKLKDGSVLRIAMQEKSEVALMVSMLPQLLVLIIIALVLSFILSRILTQKIMKPINQIDFEHNQLNPEYEELYPFLEKIQNQKQVIKEQVLDIRSSEVEFNTITDNMKEGLIVMDSNENLLSYNKSAKKMLGVEDGEFKNRHFIHFCRNEKLVKMVERALKGERIKKKFFLDGNAYQIIASPVIMDNEIHGAIIIILDETEKELREELRREFSANVSHELKTPLTSISGYAEIMQSGFVKEEDMVRFSGIIYSEAKRLITLVEDIIKISRLDENEVGLEEESVNLEEIVRENMNHLKSMAEKMNVTMTQIGGTAKISGVRQIIDEMVHNIIENAIKYNNEGGSVIVSTDTQKENKKVIVTVKDTGIGIPKEDIDRVFERFYRVDKSHSKEIGGTGLGLSIVKHGAIYHKAQIKIESELGKGTVIQIIFNM